jgi:hypothetical protein
MNPLESLHTPFHQMPLEQRHKLLQRIRGLREKNNCEKKLTQKEISVILAPASKAP